MAKVEAQLIIHRRWFFWPAAAVLVALGRLGFLKSPEWAGKWLADHAMRFEVR